MKVRRISYNDGEQDQWNGLEEGPKHRKDLSHQASYLCASSGDVDFDTVLYRAALRNTNFSNYH